MTGSTPISPRTWPIVGPGSAPCTPRAASSCPIRGTGDRPGPWPAWAFPRSASTSAGFAFSRGLPDTPTALSVDDVLAHLVDLVGATDLPVNADFQAGYAPDPDGVAANVTRALGTGVAGLSIEDASGRPDAPLFDLGQATERLRACPSRHRPTRAPAWC